MVNPFWLTAAAVLMTLRGDVPLETWTPLFENIISGLGHALANLFAFIA